MFTREHTRAHAAFSGPASEFDSSQETRAKNVVFVLEAENGREQVTVLDHVCEVRGVASDFAGTILTVRTQCV